MLLYINRLSIVSKIAILFIDFDVITEADYEKNAIFALSKKSIKIIAGENRKAFIDERLRK